MSEIRVKPRQVLILCIIFIGTIWYISRHYSNNCVNNLKNFSLLIVKENAANLPVIYAITPTYYRPVQKAELTRLSHVIMLVPNIFWVLIEDANQKSDLVKNLLNRAKLADRSTVINIKTPDKFKLKPKDPNWIKPRGVEQRNLALNWVRDNADKQKKSIVFFMDDDNTYSTELFSEMSKIEPGRVGVWPVGLVGGLMVEKPILNENKVIGFNSVWQPERPFPIDMAGFAISMDLFFQNPTVEFNYEVKRGHQESEILRNLVTRDDLQPLANSCKEILVWHTRTEKPNLRQEDALRKKGKRSDQNMEV